MVEKMPKGADEALIVNLKAKGLHTQENLLTVPEGALFTATNVNIDRDGTIQSRRGFQIYGDTLPITSGQIIDSFYSYKDKMIVHYGSGMVYDSDNAGTWIKYTGNYVAPSGALTPYGASSNGNFYFTTDQGIKKLEKITGPVKSAGQIAALDGQATLTGSSGFMTASTNVAYRIVWAFDDPNDNTIVGAPSQRIIAVNNTGGSLGKNVSLTFTVPNGITTSHFYRIYRSPLSADLITEPSDNVYQIIEGVPTASQITAGSITLTDNVPDSIRSGGAQLYTNETQETILQTNDEPPRSVDIVPFRDRMLYVNTEGKHYFDLSLKSVAGSGLVNGDTITFGGIDYTAASSEDTSTANFAIPTSGTVSELIDNTANSLVRVVNRTPLNTAVNAFYVSGYQDAPGNIRIKARNFGEPFTVVSSRPSAWRPDLTTAVESTSDYTPHYVRWSKSQQPDAVPQNGTNYAAVGSKDFPIKRAVGINQSVFFYKDDGIFRLSGTSPDNYVIDIVDPTSRLLAPNSLCSLSNTVFSFLDLAITRMNDGGSNDIVSRPVQTDLLLLASYGGFRNNTFTFPYESETKLVMFTVKNIDDTAPTQAYVYNYLTNAWTTWEFDRTMTAGFVNPRDNKIYLGCSDLERPYVYQERKTLTFADYVDDEFDVAISGYAGDNVVLLPASGAPDITPSGWWLTQNSLSSEIQQVTGSGLIVENNLSWTIGPAKIYDPIDVNVQYAPMHAGTPTVVKNFHEVEVAFREANFDDLELQFTTDMNTYTSTVNTKAKNVGGWGTFPFGTIPWGVSVGINNAQVIRKLVPRNAKRSHWIKMNLVFSEPLRNFAIQGVGYVFNVVSTRFYGPTGG